MSLSLNDRLSGALLGTALGIEAGWSGSRHAPARSVCSPLEVFDLDLSPSDEPELPGRLDSLKATPLVNLGFAAYLAAGGRATPEDFARLFRDDPGVSRPAFSFDALHSTQEVLREGMHPRLSGLGAPPHGMICAAMPAVGLFHAGDPDYAYLDGVELASVVQGRMGADWAGLCAATVAACMGGEVSAAVDAVLKIAHQECREVFYLINPYVRQARGFARLPEEDFVAWWLREARPPYNGSGYWPDWNPPLFVLPLLERFGATPEKLLPLALAAPRGGFGVSALIAAACAGALGGPEAFPAEWRAWGADLAASWQPFAGLVEGRLREETRLVQATERLAAEPVGESSRLYSKVYGCILAGAIGNAMGSPVEGRMWWEVDEQHPEGITTVLDVSRLEGEDDNQMAMLLVQTYLAREGLPALARHFGKTWHDRLNRDHFFPHCMGHAYNLIRSGWDARITGHWIQVTGSTVMCMEPVGVYHLADPAWAAQDATAVSYMYQRGLDVTAAAILAAATAEAMSPDATVDSVCAAAVAAAPATPFQTFDQRAFESPRQYLEVCLEVAATQTDVMAARQPLSERCLLYSCIDPLELLGLALAMFHIADGDVRESAIGGTNIGRDADTISGRAAMLAGTLRGAENVPADWVALFAAPTLSFIQTQARRWTDLLAGPRLARLQRRRQLLS